MKILIAEDDFTSRLLLQEILKKYGVVHVAVDGSEALEAFRSALSEGTPYDLVCMDIMMPGMDGQETLRKIRDLEENRGIYFADGAKIIMVSALGDMKNIIDAFKGLCHAYLQKPIDGQNLIRELEKLDLISPQHKS